jgi:hypothetical protein
MRLQIIFIHPRSTNVDVDEVDARGEQSCATAIEECTTVWREKNVDERERHVRTTVARTRGGPMAAATTSLGPLASRAGLAIARMRRRISRVALRI